MGQIGRVARVGQAVAAAVAPAERPRLRVLWWAQDEISYFGLPPLLDRVTAVRSHRVCRDADTVERLLREEPFDVCVLPLAWYGQALPLLAARQDTRIVLSLSGTAARTVFRPAAGMRVDAWLFERHITVDTVQETFAGLTGCHARPEVAAPREPAGGNRITRALSRVTEREGLVLHHLVQGRSNQQIARALGISVHGVKRHISNLLIKFDCSNRTEVALTAAQAGLGTLHPGL
ncbi:helix-turn-helix transcriptional regulator [Streptomyces sulfonofaciens]|uniref:helix-turn-helix transcriptional regulator n=1 Tax=Streptomyces sulfonofaciens TaxID=68272 RepID=UPI00167518EC|nr:LuxR C-terminal-related transcriptional regulator [Streptomyces sulfonofaciens]